jgi:hypothetical protein
LFPFTEWAAGALAYEMFGQKNPFKNQNYKEIYSVDDLPELKGYVLIQLNPPITAV